MKRCVILFCLSLTACASDDARHSQSADRAYIQTDQRPLATTLVYECVAYEFVARLGLDVIALWLEDRYIVLPHVRSGSGALYENGDVSFWSKGDEAMLTVAGKSYQNCHLRPSQVPSEKSETY